VAGSGWTTGRITLLGDAAHPMVQYLAQGACQAIEDAGCLARQLARYDGDPVKAFAAYQAERGPRTALVQRAAWIWGQIWHDDGMVIPCRATGPSPGGTGRTTPTWTGSTPASRRRAER
jgi:2-polyprenyl-6-methoxyphenol hydroxylase-like FAD-dependent oxidoreductase